MHARFFPFLDLPPEIREKIYTLTSTSPSPYILLDAPHAHACFPLNLLLTSTQTYHELRPLYFACNAFAITLNRRNEGWDYFLSPEWRDNRRQIRTLRLNIVRWGAKDFFCQSLVKVLEDCILNGRLRDLEVRIRDAWVGAKECWKIDIRQESKETGDGYRNWWCLGRLLRDPYLQRAVLLAGPLKWRMEKDASELDQMPFQYVVWEFDNSGEGAWRKVPRALCNMS